MQLFLQRFQHDWRQQSFIRKPLKTQLLFAVEESYSVMQLDNADLTETS